MLFVTWRVVEGAIFIDRAQLTNGFVKPVSFNYQMREMNRRTLAWTVARWGWSVIGVFLLLLICGYFEENWRGERDWRRYRAEAEARGVKLVLADFVPKPVSDAENFAAAAVFQDAFDASQAGRAIPNPFELPSGTPAAKLRDLSAWRDRFVAAQWIPAASDSAAQDVLVALRRCDPALAQLRAAASRPGCRYPVDWSQGIEARMPHLQVLQSALAVLSMRIHCLAVLGQYDAAYADWRLGMRCYQSLEGEPTLIAGLVRNAVITLLAQALQAGIGDQAWPEASLQQFAADLTGLRPLDDYAWTLASERGFTDDAYERTVRDPQAAVRVLTGAVGDASHPYRSVWRLYPTGWIRMSQLRQNELCDEMQRRVDRERRTVRNSILGDEIQAEIDRADLLQKLRLQVAYMSMPAFGTVEVTFLRTVIFVQQARIACALEIHRIQQGSYPETIEALLPHPEPRDLIDPYSGSPLHYARTAAGYRLWSVGPDRKDEGGITDPAKTRLSQLDIIWDVP